jgi:DNA-directed RNA polymerase specialized sigma24 family protein
MSSPEQSTVKRAINEQRRDDVNQITPQKMGRERVLSLELVDADATGTPVGDANGCRPASSATERLIAAIETLQPNLRDVINALFWERATERTVAERFGVSQRTIRNWRDIAIAHLQTALIKEAS